MATHLRAVATRGNIPYGFNSATGDLMCRSAHFARDAIVGLQVVYSNWYIDTGNNTGTFAELGTGTTATIKVGFETAGGAFSQFLFNGSSSGSVASGADIVSDVLPVSLSAGDKFYCRPLWHNTGGILYMPLIADVTLGDRMEFTATDKTVSGTVANQQPNYAQCPSALIGLTAKPSAMLFGTSRTFGFNDTPDGVTGDVGIMARCIGPLAAYSNFGVPADSLQTFAPNSAKRVALANAYFSDTYIEHGVNDSSRTLLQKQTDLATIMSALTTRKRLVTTSPNTSGAWTAPDGSDQTAIQDFTAWNAYLKTQPNGSIACYDVATDHQMVSSPLKWKAPGFTTDGLHGSQAAYLLSLANNSIGINAPDDASQQAFAKMVM